MIWYVGNYCGDEVGIREVFELAFDTMVRCERSEEVPLGRQLPTYKMRSASGCKNDILLRKERFTRMPQHLKN